MFRSYVGVIAVLCLAGAVGCDSESTNPGGSGGTAGTGGTAGVGGGTGGTGGGTGGTGGGTGGTGGAGGGMTETLGITLGCSNSVTEDVSILDWELSVTTEGDVLGGEDFDAELDGVAFFAESFLDAAQAVVPGGVKKAALTDVAATVLVRSGATGDPVTLGPSDLPSSCAIDGADCDSTNNAEDGSNPACVPVGAFNQCLKFVEIPNSDDCDEGGVCDLAGKTSQCETNGFCVTGPLPLELEAAMGSYTADASGDILFGWDDQDTDVNEDGTYDLPAAVFSNPTPPNGLRVVALLSVALQCVMAVDSGGPDGVGVSDQSSPTPDSALLAIPIVE